MITKDLETKICDAIIKKYGSHIEFNFDSFWDKLKEEKFLLDLRENCSKQISDGFVNKIEKFNKNCLKCGRYSLNRNDDLYLNKYFCCQMCYINLEDLGKISEWEKKIYMK